MNIFGYNNCFRIYLNEFISMNIFDYNNYLEYF